MYKHIKAYQEQKEEWDELREQRVYNAISAQRAALEVSLARKRKQRRTIALGAIAAAALVTVAVAIGIILRETPSDEGIEQRAPIVAAKDIVPEPKPADSSEGTSILTLESAGQVTLLDEAAVVSVIEQQNDSVLLEQKAGQALYSIRHRKGREVKVQAAGIDVTVVGTVFIVTIDEPVVRVEVKQGVVRVDDGTQVVTLENSETISVSIPDKATFWQRPTKKKGTARVTGARGETSAEDLFAQVDAARRKGDLKTAAKLLRRIVAQKESPFSVASAEFTLGKVERSRGRHGAAARAFHQCAKQTSNLPLGEDALAEAALSFQAAGNIQMAKTVAQIYLKDYPRGMYVVKMKRLID